MQNLLFYNILNSCTYLTIYLLLIKFDEKFFRMHTTFFSYYYSWLDKLQYVAYILQIFFIRSFFNITQYFL